MGQRGVCLLGETHEQEQKRGLRDLCPSTQGRQEFAGLVGVGLLGSQAGTLAMDVLA